MRKILTMGRKLAVTAAYSFVIAYLLAGCGVQSSKPNGISSPKAISSDTTNGNQNGSQTDNTIYIVPTSCKLDGVNAAFAKIIPPSKYIATKWQPAPGTDLYAAINGGGIACSYGDQEAEVGGTILWALNKNGLWDSRVAQWKKDGLVAVDIPGVNESAAYKLPDGATSADNLPAWRVNLLIGNLWIQLGAAFIQSLDEATPIIKAAIAAAK